MTGCWHSDGPAPRKRRGSHGNLLAILLRRPLSSFVPLVAAFLAALAGEALDLRDDVRSLGYWRWQASLGDVLNTTFWPFVIWLLARVRMLPHCRTGHD
jgi:hypothetical protein